MRRAFMLTAMVVVLLAPLAAGTITVSSPNGGEPMALGGTWQIAWTATNVTKNVKIQLIKPGGAIIGVIAPNLAPGGSPFPWTVGQTNNGTAAAGDYKIRVMALDGSASDGSDKAFTITEAGPVPPPPPPSGDPTLQLTSFNDGGIFPLGMPQNITWNANWSGTVKLELYQNGTRIGIIDNGVASQPGTYPWNVGTMLLKKAGKGEGYKVRVVKEYKWLEPVPLDRLDDESDNAFKIGLSLSDLTPVPTVMPIKVSAPEEGRVYEYDSFIINDERTVKVGCQWTTDSAGPFEFFLHEVGNKTETPLQPIKAPSTMGNQTYQAELKLSTNHTDPGLSYKIHVRSADQKASGFSGKFQLKYKLHTALLSPRVINKWHSAHSEYNQSSTMKPYDFSGLHKRFPEIPPNTQVGFANWYYSNPDGTWSYAGLVFRSRIVFDFSEFKNLKGYYSEAKLLIKQNEGGNSQFIDPADCDVRVYVLEQAWPGGDFFNTYGNHLIQNFPNGIPNDFDIPDWATAWTNGTSFNAGLLLVMAMEKMNHDKLFAIRRYEILLKVQFQEN